MKNLDSSYDILFPTHLIWISKSDHKPFQLFFFWMSLDLNIEYHHIHMLFLDAILYLHCYLYSQIVLFN